MSTLRDYKARTTGLAPAVPSKLRDYRARTTGVSSTGKLRDYRARTTGSAVAPVVAALSNQTRGPGENITATAVVVSGGGTGTTFAWRRVSGPTVTGLPATGATLTFATPSVVGSAAVPLVIGVTATASGTPSQEVQFTVNVLPQTVFSWDPVNRVWVGAVVAPA